VTSRFDPTLPDVAEPFADEDLFLDGGIEAAALGWAALSNFSGRILSPWSDGRVRSRIAFGGRSFFVIQEAPAFGMRPILCVAELRPFTMM
jgi:hypothetical protein